MCRDTFCTFGPKFRSINQGGGQKYTIWERSLQWESKGFSGRTIGGTREKLLQQKSKILCDAPVST